MISSFLVILPSADNFLSLSGCFVRGKNRIKSGFSPAIPCLTCIFGKWVQIGIFADFGEKIGKTGEKKRKKAIQKYIHRRAELQTDKIYVRGVSNEKFTD
jgi:hypothetical protein